MNGARAYYFEFSVRRFSIKVGEVVIVPEPPIFSSESASEILLNLFSSMTLRKEFPNPGAHLSEFRSLHFRRRIEDNRLFDGEEAISSDETVDIKVTALEVVAD
jgi:hypothetical protein